MTDVIQKSTTVLASGKPATILRINAKNFAVQPLFLQRATPFETSTAQRLGEAMLKSQLTPVVPASMRLATPETLEIDHVGEVTVFAERAKRAVATAAIATAPLHLLRLASADLPHDALSLNVNYFLFSTEDLTAPWDAYGDPIGLVAHAGIIETPPQLSRTCLIKDENGYRFDRIAFADCKIELPDGTGVRAHPFGRPDAEGGTPLAFSLFHGSVGGSSPVEKDCFDVAYLGRYPLAGKRGGGMPSLALAVSLGLPMRLTLKTWRMPDRLFTDWRVSQSKRCKRVRRLFEKVKPSGAPAMSFKPSPWSLMKACRTCAPRHPLAGLRTGTKLELPDSQPVLRRTVRSSFVLLREHHPSL